MISIDVIQRSAQMLLPDLDGRYWVISVHENTHLGSFLKFRTSINYIFGEKGEKYLKWFFFIPPVIAVNLEIPVIWLMADAAVGFLVIPNIIALILLRKEFKSEYQRFTERNSQEKLQQI